MANTPDYHWPPVEKRKVIGKSFKRVDGPVKASGRAKYSSDHNIKGLLFGAYLTSPYAHARVTSIDTADAEKMNGVKAVHLAVKPGTEVQWQGFEVAAVAATTEEIANDAVRKIKVEYEVLPHLVKEDDLTKVGTRGKAAGEKVQGDPDKAFQDAEHVSEGGIRDSGGDALLPGAARSGDPVEGGRQAGRLRRRDHRLADGAVRLRVCQFTGSERESAGCQHPGEHGLHRRRIRQQVRPGRLGRGGSQPLQEGGWAAGEAVPGPRHRTADRGQPSFGIRQDQDRRQEATARSRRGNPTDGAPAGSEPSAGRRFRT